MEELDRAAVYGLLRKAIREAGSQKAFARQIGISPQFLSDALHDRRDIPAAALRHLGVERVETFRRVRRNTSHGE